MRRLLTAFQLTSGLLAGALVALYVLGRVATDRTHITQYLFWTPWIVYAGLLLLLGGFAWLCSRLRRRRRERRPRRWTWALPGVSLGLIFLHVALAEWHAWRYVIPVRRGPAAGTLRIMHWNMTYAVPYWWDRYIAAVRTAPLPDVLIVTNPTYRNDLDDLAAALGPEFKAVRCGDFGIFSRLPILNRSNTTLGIPIPPSMADVPGLGADESPNQPPRTDFLPEWSPIPRTGSNVHDPGSAMCVRIDATEKLGREIVIWGIDLPSQPRAWRMDFARPAAARLDALAAPPAATADSRDSFPSPDLILGDCNTPRGSASLKLISHAYPHAFDQAGRGHVASWPRKWAIFHIDHIFVGPGLRATSYRTMDMGISEHRAQVAEFVAK